MSQNNFKYIAALFIVCLSLSEILIFNEEVFLFVCFFVFFNAVTTFGGPALTQTFDYLSFDFEKNFRHVHIESYEIIHPIIKRKQYALSFIDRTLTLLKVFCALSVQYGLLSALESFYHENQFCLFAFQSFSLLRKSLPISIDQLYRVQGYSLLMAERFKSVNPFRTFNTRLILANKSTLL